MAFVKPYQPTTAEGYNALNAVPIPLPPTGPTLIRSASSTATLSGTPLTQTFADGQTMCHFVAGAYPIAWRWRAEGDSNGVTVVAGLYPYDDEIASGDTWRAIPAGKTSVVCDWLTVQPNITIIGK
jgi:hypothetical protein